MSIFEDWELWGAIHDDEDQKKRIDSSSSSKCLPRSIDINAGAAEFIGSKGRNYYTSLDACQCRDFFVRQKPCKHMYRLAVELGLMNIDGVKKVTETNVYRMTPEEIKREIDKLSDSAREILLEFLTRYHSNDLSAVESVCSMSDDIKELFCAGIINRGKNPARLLENETVASIQKVLKESSISGYGNIKKRADLIEWVLKNVDDVSALFPDRVVIVVNEAIGDIDKITQILLREKLLLNLLEEERISGKDSIDSETIKGLVNGVVELFWASSHGEFCIRKASRSEKFALLLDGERLYTYSTPQDCISAIIEPYGVFGWDERFDESAVPHNWGEWNLRDSKK